MRETLRNLHCNRSARRGTISTSASSRRFGASFHRALDGPGELAVRVKDVTWDESAAVATMDSSRSSPDMPWRPLIDMTSHFPFDTT